MIYFIMLSLYIAESNIEKLLSDTSINKAGCFPMWKP